MIRLPAMLGCLTLGLGSIHAQTPDQKQPLPEVSVPFTDARIAIDGLLDEPAWRTAAVIDHWVGPKAEPRGSGARCLLLWTTTHLLVAFEVEDADIFATMTGRDDELWKEDAFEIFLDPDGDGRNYFEFQFNAVGGVFDGFFIDNPRLIPDSGLWSYDCKGLLSSAKILKDPATGKPRGWLVETSIPYASLLRLPHTPPEPGDTWRANIVRRDFPIHDQPTEEWYWSASYAKRWPHMTERFGLLRFVR